MDLTVKGEILGMRDGSSLTIKIQLDGVAIFHRVKGVIVLFTDNMERSSPTYIGTWNRSKVDWMLERLEEIVYEL